MPLIACDVTLHKLVLIDRPTNRLIDGLIECVPFDVESCSLACHWQMHCTPTLVCVVYH